MRAHRLAALALLLAAAPALAQTPAASDGQRFDVQSFRPSGAPQDLVIVSQSRPLAHLSASVGLVLDFALDPLVLVLSSVQKKQLSLVGSRLQLDAVAAIGLFDWIELGFDLPLILTQESDNLEAIGAEGTIRSFAQGDLRTTVKIAIPGLRRKAEASGFGGALTFGLGFPTGVQEAFTSDGEITYQPGFILDYRFDYGILLAVNGGYWSRPKGEFNGLALGPMATFGAAAEVPIIRRWGVTAVGSLFGGASLLTLPEKGHQVPAEWLVALRWYSSSGLTFTFGGGGGCGCSFGAPTFRLFLSIIWVPGKTREYEAIERFKIPPEQKKVNLDPDKDEVYGKEDACPNTAGPKENNGCPDEDRDNDGIVDRLDKCPSTPATEHGRNGCPLARVQGDRILILEQVHFATDQDVILPESFPILEEVARIMVESPLIERIRIEGHTDSRASDEYNLDLSQRRANNVMKFLIDHGVAEKRLRAEGYGLRRPLAPNESDAGMALNRRVEFLIVNIPPEETEAPVKGKKTRRTPTQFRSAPLPKN